LRSVFLERTSSTPSEITQAHVPLIFLIDGLPESGGHMLSLGLGQRQGESEQAASDAETKISGARRTSWLIQTTRRSSQRERAGSDGEADADRNAQASNS
jgi:hypothetical protein